MNLSIRPLQKADLERLKEFADQVIGVGYYTLPELEEIFVKSQRNGKVCSFILEDDKRLLGFRFTYPPGNWSHGKGKGLSPHLWNIPLPEVAYFQSLFLHPDMQGEGMGQKLSQASIDVLRELGTKAIVCHSWVESPHNSSSKYLAKLGFKALVQHRNYWKDVNYVCPICGSPCLCTAEEMILHL